MGSLWTHSKDQQGAFKSVKRMWASLKLSSRSFLHFRDPKLQCHWYSTSVSPWPIFNLKRFPDMCFLHLRQWLLSLCLLTDCSNKLSLSFKLIPVPGDLSPGGCQHCQLHKPVEDHPQNHLQNYPENRDDPGWSSHFFVAQFDVPAFLRCKNSRPEPWDPNLRPVRTRIYFRYAHSKTWDVRRNGFSTKRNNHSMSIWFYGAWDDGFWKSAFFGALTNNLLRCEENSANWSQ